MDCKDERFFKRIQLRMNGCHRHVSEGSGPQGATPTTLSSPNTHEKGFYQILMNKMEMDCKDERFFKRIQLRMNGCHRCASRGSGGHPHHPVLAQHP